MAKKKPNYIFRGTSKGFEGNATHKKLIKTCTTRNPAKAVLFAIDALNFPHESIVLIARYETVMALEDPNANVFENLEEEIDFKMLPRHFEKYCNGYVTLQNAQECLSKMGINTRFPIQPGSLNRYLDEINEMSEEEIDKFMNLIEPLIVKL